jgi:hypothetical protein
MSRIHHARNQRSIDPVAGVNLPAETHHGPRTAAVRQPGMRGAIAHDESEECTARQNTTTLGLFVRPYQSRRLDLERNMAATVKYDIVNTYGGTPPEASHKSFKLFAANVATTRSEVEDDADDDEWETPCVQNSMVGFATLTETDFDYVDALVTLWGCAIECGIVTGTGRVVHGLAWHFSDHMTNTLVKGLIRAAAPPPVPKTVGVFETWAMRIPTMRRTRVCDAGCAGGLTIAPNPGSYYVSNVVTIVMAYHVRPINGYFKGDSESPMFGSAAGAPGFHYQSGEQFYAAAFRKEIGEMASSIQATMQREVEEIVARETAYLAKRTGQG